MRRVIFRTVLIGLLTLLLVPAIAACTTEPADVEVTRIVEVTRVAKAQPPLAEIKEVEVTREVEVEVPIEVPVEVTRVGETVIVEVEVTRLVAEAVVTRVVEVPVEVEVTRIVTEEIIVEVPSETEPPTELQDEGFIIGSSLYTGRHDHTASGLKDGRVLVVGGAIGGWQGPSLVSTEIYDPRSQSWQVGPTLNFPRQAHTATVLPDGRIFVTGGTQPGPTWQASTEMLDAERTRWDIMAPMAFPRSMHSATLLSDGRIIVLGGWTGSVTLDHAEIYDPSTNVWRQTGSLLEARQDHSATLLADGRILIVGGYRERVGDKWLSTAEIYNPVNGTSTATYPLFCHGTSHQVVTLADGRVLVVGGACGSGQSGIVAQVELFDPATDSWHAVTSMAQARFGLTATRLSDGTVLAIGGGDGLLPLASVEKFDPVTQSWSFYSPLNRARVAHTATLLPDGQLLVVGGWAGDTMTLRSVELLDTNN
jgi:N-acetylneuraminic acid mutarotase